MRRTLLLTGVSCIALLVTSPAGATPIRHGTSGAPQPGIGGTYSATPSVPGAWHILTSGAWGIDPSALTEGDARQRAAGRFGVGYSPWSFLQIGLSFDASVDSYQWAGDDPDSLVVGALGDPRISLRTGWELGAGFCLGGLFELWIPSGRGAFNLVGDSISPSLFLALSYAPEAFPLGIHLDVGFRHDRSLRMLGDLGQLTAEQLLLSGATSVENALALRFAVEYRIGPVAPYVETSADLPLADGMDTTPVLLGVGARIWLGPTDEVQLTVGGEFRVTPAPEAPDPVAGTVWLDPPLATVMVGATFRLPVAPTERVVEVEGEGGGGGEAEPPPQAVEPGRIEGRVRCGDASCGSGARVRISGTGGSAYAPDDETGGFTTAPLPPGTYTVEAVAPGHEAARQEVEVSAGGTARTDFELAAAAGAERPGVRGRVTNFEGQPVAATVRIPALDVELTCDGEGRFETEADPGNYEVIVSASGFRTQTIRVEVTQAGVVVLNVELRQR